MKTLIYMLVFSLFILSSCGMKYKYWEISKFNMDKNALEDKEEIKLIYTSRGPDSNTDLEYYIHIIAVSQKTGDTVNILTTADNDLKEGDGDKIFNFFNEDNFATKLMQMDFHSLKGSTDINKIQNAELKKIDKVARDPEFDYIADNKFPTIIGVIGTVSQNDTISQ